MVEIECPKLFHHFLDVHLRMTEKEGRLLLIYEQSNYVRMLLLNFAKDMNGSLRLARTPGMSQKDAEELKGQGPGIFAKVCRTHLGALFYMARSTRPALSEAVGSLAHTVNEWTTASDHRLVKIMG